MVQIQFPKARSVGYSRCDKQGSKTEYGKELTPSQKLDAEIRENIYHAFWKEDVLRALEYFEIDVFVKDGDVYLSGHILSASSRGRIDNALQGILGIVGITNNLVLDDNLTLEVATSLGELEHAHGCKFFTGASHGVVSLNGKVKSLNIKLLAEQRASANPNVRGVINNIQVVGDKSDVQPWPFLQPVIGVIVYFLDGISGVVTHVVINPNNRRVDAIIMQGHFGNQERELQTMDNSEARRPEQLIVVPMNAVRFLTKNSGFLHIRSYESNRYMDFDPEAFTAPDLAWIPPYPYCPNDILFSIKYQDAGIQIPVESQKSPFGAVVEAASLREKLFATDSLGL